MKVAYMLIKNVHFYLKILDLDNIAQLVIRYAMAIKHESK